MLVNSIVCNGTMHVIVRIFTAFSMSMQKPICAGSPRQQLRFLNTRNDWEMIEHTTFASRVYARTDFDCALIVDELFPNVIAKCGRTCRRRWFESEIRLYTRVTASLTSRANFNDLPGSCVLLANEFIRHALFRRRLGSEIMFSSVYYNYRCLRASAMCFPRAF